MATASPTLRLLVASVPIAGGLIGAGGEIAWPRPTRPDDVLSVESEVLAIGTSRSRLNRSVVTLRATTLNQRHETPQVSECKLVVPRRSVSGPMRIDDKNTEVRRLFGAARFRTNKAPGVDDRGGFDGGCGGRI